MVRQAHHERNQQLAVRPELVEGLVQRFPNSPPHVQKYWVICFLFLSLVGCASNSQQLQELSIPPQKLYQPGYSLLTLNEKGWSVASRNPYQLALVKRGNHADETFAIQGIASRLPAFVSSDDFVRMVKEGQAADTPSPRFRMMEHNVVPDSSRHTQCARSHTISEDNDAVKRTSTSGSMILEAATLTCAHPGNKILGISIIYSHRYYPGQADRAFMQKADQIFNSVEFTELGEGSS